MIEPLRILSSNFLFILLFGAIFYVPHLLSTIIIKKAFNGGNQLSISERRTVYAVLLTILTFLNFLIGYKLGEITEGSVHVMWGFSLPIICFVWLGWLIRGMTSQEFLQQDE